MPKRSDRHYLTEVAYADPSGLNARASLYDYQHPRINLPAEARSLLGDIDGCTVVDVGCGDGRYVSTLHDAGARVVAVDQSKGMLDGIPPPRPPSVVADAQHLPFADASVDVVLQMHMLYHVPDPARAVADARRVLRDGARLIAAVNSRRHLQELNALWLPFLDKVGVRADVEDSGLANPRVTSDEARALLTEAFGTVEERALTSSVTVGEPDPIVRYAASTTGANTATEVLERFATEVGARIDADGELRITTEVVMFLAV